MKAIKFLSVMFLATVLLTSCDKNDDEYANEIPKDIAALVKEVFPNNKIKKIEEVIYGDTKTYKVKLEGDIELKFNSNQELIKIESKTKLPDTLFDAKILDYISTHYPDNYIVGWELEGLKQE
ncbi:MAG: PepSY-like domain-containing protein, partial [Dysgonamonadaceae bacterium]|nr:PepSY-like domain-containing protein [Dysgonamonadaceae bacterium]